MEACAPRRLGTLRLQTSYHGCEITRRRWLQDEQGENAALPLSSHRILNPAVIDLPGPRDRGVRSI
jgi:hypothetical protein